MAMLKKKSSPKQGDLEIYIGSIDMLLGEAYVKGVKVKVVRETDKMLFLENVPEYHVPGKVLKTALGAISRRTELLGDTIRLTYRCIAKKGAKKIVVDAMKSYLTDIVPKLKKIKL